MTRIYTDNGKALFKLTRNGRRDKAPWEFVCLIKSSDLGQIMRNLEKNNYKNMGRFEAQNKYGDLPEEE